MSTLALITDPTSPLYTQKEFDEGFQFKDIKTAYNRSAKVSTGQALTKSAFTQPVSAAVLSLGKISLADREKTTGGSGGVPPPGVCVNAKRPVMPVVLFHAFLLAKTSPSDTCPPTTLLPL